MLNKTFISNHSPSHLLLSLFTCCFLWRWWFQIKDKEIKADRALGGVHGLSTFDLMKKPTHVFPFCFSFLHFHSPISLNDYSSSEAGILGICNHKTLLKSWWVLAKVTCQLVIVLPNLPAGKVLFQGSVKIRQTMLKRIHWCIWVLAGFSEDSILVLFVILVSKLHLAHWFGQPLNIRDLQVVNSVNWPMGRSGSVRRAWATVQRQREDTSYWICHKTIFIFSI